MSWGNNNAGVNIRVDDMTNSGGTLANSRGIYIYGDNNRVAGSSRNNSGTGAEITGDLNTLASMIVADNTTLGIHVESGEYNELVACVASDNGADTGIDNTNEDNFLDEGDYTMGG